jgi:threonine dehydrogenase-like Zn-dependent dehydrogenase
VAWEGAVLCDILCTSYRGIGVSDFKMGADLALDPTAEGPGLVDKIQALYGGMGADVVVEAAGSPQSFELCMKLARAGGQVLNLAR